METFQTSSYGIFLMNLFAGILSAPSFTNFLILAYGWSMSSSRHTITTYLWLNGAVKYKHFSRFYIFLSDPFFKSLEQFWIGVILLADQWIAEGEKIRLKTDDSTRKKSGKKISGASYYRNGAGTARQEYKTLWGLNFVYGIMSIPLRRWPGFRLYIPIGLKLYLKEEVAKELGKDFYSRSQLARQIIDLVAKTLPHRRILVSADGGYATKDFLRNLPDNIDVVSRFPIDSKLLALPSKTPKAGCGPKPKKGALIGSPKTLKRKRKGWKAHPSEERTLVNDWLGIWHSVLPGIIIRIVVVKRTNLKPSSLQKPLEAFFTTDLALGVKEILQEYHCRWDVEIAIRDANAYFGLAKDQCRKYERIIGVNHFRMLMAACRVLWWIEQIDGAKHLKLKRNRTWYLQKEKPSQLDVQMAFQEAMQWEGIIPTPSFLQDMHIIQNKIKAAYGRKQSQAA